MAWLWWLMAPVVSTVLAGAISAAHARREDRGPARATDGMAEHRRLTEALQRSSSVSDLPATMIVLEPGPDPLSSAG